MKNLTMFIPLTKVDEEKRTVYGIATAEQPDQSGEICDYETTVPYYKAWSERISKASDGKSKGNLRAMHSSIAAGKVTSITFNDVAKQIEISAKVVDDDEWKKVLEGVYTGFSQGGRYVKTWRDGEFTKYTAEPSEISLVDNPCLHTATFTLMRADGVEEMRKFKEPEVKKDKPKDMGPKQVWQASDGSTYATKVEAVQKNAELSASAIASAGMAAAAEINAVLGKKEFSDKEREKDADEGKALPDGSFPIENKEDLKNAIQAYGRAKDKEKAKEHIIARAKALGADDMLPEEWNGKKKAEKSELPDFKKYVGEEIWDSKCAIEALGAIQCLLLSELSENENEPGQIADLQAVIDRLKSFIASEILESGNDEMMMSANVVEKKGAAISAATKSHLDKMYKSASDHVSVMNECMKGLGMAIEESKEDKQAEKVAQLESENATLSSEKEALTKAIGDMNATMEKLLTRVKHLEDQPLPAKGALYSVEKRHEVNNKPVEADKPTKGSDLSFLNKAFK